MHYCNKWFWKVSIFNLTIRIPLVLKIIVYVEIHKNDVVYHTENTIVNAICIAEKCI